MLEGGKEDPAPGAQEMGDEAAELKAILSPEQYAQFESFQQEEQTARMETMATFELNQIGPLLGLSEDQKDRVFEALVAVAPDSPAGSGPFGRMTGRTGNTEMQGEYKQREEAKLEALADILDGRQLALYRQKLESEREMHETMTRAWRRGSSGTPAPVPPAAPSAQPAP